jgi:hypothetical protein
MKPMYAIFAALAATSIMAFAAESLSPLPEGWFIAGQSPEQYKAGIDHTQTSSGKGAKYIRSKPEAGGSWGSLMQMFSAEKYRGKRVRLQARVKTKEVSGWAGLWMRVDTEGGPRSFYNSQDKPIKGSTEWTVRSVVLDVPAGAGAIAFGVIANGTGQVWIDELSLEPVPTSVPLDVMPASRKMATAPVL